MSKPLHVVGAAIVDETRCLVAQRGPGMALAGLWEFPGGKVEPREAPQDALAREVREELGLEIAVGPWIGRGESVVDGREVVLDVYYSTIVSGKPRPKEHSETRWVNATQVDSLDWPEADRPILPMVRRVLSRGIEDRPVSKPVPVVSVDWSMAAKGRAVYAARPQSGEWVVERSAPPDGGWSLRHVLSLARQIGEPSGGSCLVAIDAVFGVPASFGALTGEDDFPALLVWLERNGALAEVIRDPDRWSPQTPFFAVATYEHGLNGYIECAGGRSILFRQVERATGGNTVFATSGIPGTVGGGSLALWREILDMRRSGMDAFRLWPFEIELEDVASSGCPVLAESYPRACYAVALGSTLPARLLRVSKTNRAERTARLMELCSAEWVQRRSVAIRDVERAESSEDDFDALMQAAAIVRLIDAGVPLVSHTADHTLEGGILGTGGLSLGQPAVPRADSGRKTPRRRSTERQLGTLKRCPIEGCQKVFQLGRLGWDAHVGSARRHPDWEPALSSPAARKAAFRVQFADWFDD